MQTDSNYRRPFSVIRLLGGMLLGLVIGLACIAVDFVIGSATMRRPFLLPVANAIVLIVAATFAIKRVHDGGWGRGLLISLSLVFILNAICGIILIR